jgi:transcriptional regulator with GAF, ATPase, and Fis domain
MERISTYSWPGNVRELQNVIECAVILSRGKMLELQHELVASSIDPEVQTKIVAPLEGAPAPAPPNAKLPTLKEVERSHILAALRSSSGVIEGANGAAKILHLHPNTLRNRMAKLGIKRADHQI